MRSETLAQIKGKDNVRPYAMSRTRRLIGILLVAPFVLYIVTFFVIPLLAVAGMSTFTVDDAYHLVPAWNLDQFREAFSTENVPILWRSAEYAGLTTLLCMLLGFPLAWFISRYGKKYRKLHLALIMLPFWTSYLIRIFAWMTILQSDGVLNGLLLRLGIIDEPLILLNTQFSVVLGLTYGFLPFTTLPIWSCLERLDVSLLEASADLGATPRETFCKIVLPLSMPGIVAGGLLTFVPAMGDFVTPEILGGIDTQMIGNLIQQQFLASYNWPLGAALSLLLMLLMIAMMLAFVKATGSWEDLV